MDSYTHIHATVDRVLLEQGDYNPLELLIETGRITYKDYEAWRCGEIDVLEDVLLGNQERILDLLKAAADWAQKLALKPVTKTYQGWGKHADQRLRLSHHPQIVKLLSVHYQRRQGASPQLDIFLDSSDLAILNQLRTALTAREYQQAEKQLHLFIARFPNHPLRDPAERLFDALNYIDRIPPPEQAERELQTLSTHLLPAAQAVLASRARDFMIPFWRNLATSFDNKPFNANNSRAHASWIYAQCLDWQAVRACVLVISDFRQEPELLIRLAEAEYRLGNSQAAIQQWCSLCWQFPTQAAALFNNDSFPDPHLKFVWDAFRDLDLEPMLAIDWFPAWFMLNEPKYLQAICADGENNESTALTGFRALQKLLCRTSEMPEDQIILLRKTLQSSHPGFLSLYLNWRERNL